jgi:hypothetical protein
MHVSVVVDLRFMFVAINYTLKDVILSYSQPSTMIPFSLL